MSWCADFAFRGTCCSTQTRIVFETPRGEDMCNLMRDYVILMRDA